MASADSGRENKIISALGAEGYPGTSVTDGQKALGILKKGQAALVISNLDAAGARHKEDKPEARVEKPGLVLLDINMPVMDGWDAIKAIRNDESLKDIPVPVLTAYAASEENSEISKAGFLMAI